MNFFDDEEQKEEEYIDPKKRLAMKSLENYEKSIKEEEKKEIYQYDEIYEDLKKGKKKEEKKKEASSKYIGNMKKVVEERKFIQNQIQEMKNLERIEKEKEIYGETEVFYTKEYEDKLLNDKRKKEALENKEYLENQSKKDVGSFLLNVNQTLIGKKEEEDLEFVSSNESNIDLDFASSKESDFVKSSLENEEKVQDSKKEEKVIVKKDIYQRPNEEYIHQARERAKLRMELRLKNK